MEKKDLIVLRDDGFSYLFQFEPPCTKERLLAQCVDWLEREIQIKEIGMGAGEARTYNTQVGDRIGEDDYLWGVPESVLKEIEAHSGDSKEIKRIYEQFLQSPEGKTSWLRLGDFWAMANLRYLIAQGTDPFEVICNRAHEMGMRVWGREELRGCLPSKYADRKDFLIPDSYKPDYKHELIRKYREDIFTEIVRKGADGVSIDFCVYPPYFENPEKDGHYFTQFFKDLRARFEREFDRKIDIVARLPFQPEQYGLFWQDWVKEGVVDVLIPSVIKPGELFDVPIDEYIMATKNTDCKVFGCLRPKCTTIDPDPKKGDGEKGIVRLNRPVTVENDRARAALLLRAGAEGLQIALGTALKYDPNAIVGSAYDTDQWKPYYATIGNAETLQYADKTYPLINPKILSTTLYKDKPSVVIPFRIADDPLDTNGHTMSAFICPIMRNLEDNERLWIRVNDGEKIVLDKNTLKGNQETPTSFDHTKVVLADEIHFGVNWWLKGRKSIEVSPDCLKFGNNQLEIGFDAPDGELEIIDVDVEIKYGER